MVDSNVGVNLDKTAASPTIVTNISRRMTAPLRPVKTVVGGVIRIEVWAGCGLAERRRYGSIKETPVVKEKELIGGAAMNRKGAEK
jgi:hypothetical protein